MQRTNTKYSCEIEGSKCEVLMFLDMKWTDISASVVSCPHSNSLLYKSLVSSVFYNYKHPVRHYHGSVGNTVALSAAILPVWVSNRSAHFTLSEYSAKWVNGISLGLFCEICSSLRREDIKITEQCRIQGRTTKDGAWHAAMTGFNCVGVTRHEVTLQISPLCLLNAGSDGWTSFFGTSIKDIFIRKKTGSFQLYYCCLNGPS